MRTTKKKAFWMSLVMLFVSSNLLFAQQITVTGNVTDATDNEPIVGVSVSLVGTNQGTITDVNGKYSLNVDANSELKFNYIGYESITQPTTGKKTLNIALKRSNVNLSEIVVLGYGQETRKADLSVAVSQKDIGEDVKSRSTDLIGAMQGQIAGVTIANNSGDPLSTPSITIRGKGSRDGEQPLFVVDGVSGAPYNQEDVESITVLKDAASAAIYGTNVGSGGVILITTKKAKAGKIKVTARANYGVQSVWRKPEMLTAEEYVKVRTDAAILDGKSVPNGIDPSIYPYGQTTRTNWIDEIFRVGQVQKYAFTVSGGSDILKAYSSLEYNKAEGTLLNTYSENFGAKINLDYKINNLITLSQRLTYRYSNGQGQSRESNLGDRGIHNSGHTGVTTAAMFMPPSATVYEMDKDGNYVLDSRGNRMFGGTVPLWAKDLGVAGTFGEVVNPVATLSRLNQNRPNQNLFSTTSLVVSPMDHLKIRSEFSMGSENFHYDDFQVRVLEIGKTNDQNSRRIASSNKTNWLWETVASYDRTIKKHQVSGMIGYSMKYQKYTGLSVTLYDFPDEDQYSQHFINGTDWTKTKPVESFDEESQISAYLRGAYSYDNRYFFTASVRRDASSKLYKDNNSGIFPAVSGAWKISSESFLRDSKIISLLKLRASWGQIGNVAGVRNYSYLSNFSQTGSYAYLGSEHQNPIIGLGLNTFPNKDLRWETSEQTDLGFDLEFLKGQLSFSVDYYMKKTKDLIDNVPVASVAGVSVDPLGNVGSVMNKGFEFTVGYGNAAKNKNKLGYQFDFNLSTLKSEVLDLGSREYIAHTDKSVRALYPLRSTVGQAWYSYYVIRTNGLFQSQEEINAYVNPTTGQKIQPNARPGDLKYVDYNGDGIISEADGQYSGSYTPTLTYGFNLALNYRGFDLGLSLQGVSGNKIFNGVTSMTHAAGQGWNMSSRVLDSWAYNHNSNIPLVSMSDDNGNYSKTTDFFLEDGSYMRLKNVTIGYTFPKGLFGNKINSLRAYITGENLLTFTNYSGMDPEVGNYGLDGGTYPTSRVVSMGLHLAF